MEKTRTKTDIWSIFMYLILYSIAGFLIETTFGIFTKGVIESRKSFLYGPFCVIYGIGAIAMILILKNQKNIFKLFFAGAIIGAVVEYSMSLFCELFFGVKWWDYSNLLLNINGRTCLFYAVSWGILAIVLIRFVNPYVDKFIYALKQKKTIFQFVTAFLIAFLSIDAIITSYALKVFYYRISIENNLNIDDKVEAYDKYAQIQKSHNLSSFINKYYNDEKMLEVYPNMIISEANNNMVYIENLVDRVKPY